MMRLLLRLVLAVENIADVQVRRLCVEEHMLKVEEHVLKVEEHVLKVLKDIDKELKPQRNLLAKQQIFFG